MSVLPKYEQIKIIERALKIMEEMVKETTPLLQQQGVKAEKVCVCGSLARLEARCPRDYRKFMGELLMSVEVTRPPELEKGKIVSTIREIEKKCDNVDCFIDNVKSELERKPSPELKWLYEESKLLRCSDVDGKIVLSNGKDKVYETIGKLGEYVDRKNREIMKELSPLTPEIGFTEKKFAEEREIQKKCICKKLD